MTTYCGKVITIITCTEDECDGTTKPGSPITYGCFRATSVKLDAWWGVTGRK